mmetsp:Transcript_6537/g.5827  ORF Transcript_6537/g.5827 Transcript_6537/m.5827 type:complete len:176 (-) Transcript_6537:661-1188(-)
MQFVNENYTAQEFQSEFKQNLKNIWTTLPLAVRGVILIKTCLYIVSFFTSVINEGLTNYPQKVLSSCQIWRLLLAPFVTTNFFEFSLLMPYFLMKFAYKKEFKKGTLFALIYFSINNFCYQFLVCILSLPFLVVSQDYFKAFYTSGLFPIILMELFIHLMRNPNRLTVLCVFTCP